MSTNKPEDPANIQMTPVEFSPTATDDALGSVGGKLSMGQINFPVAVPLAIILVTLIFSTLRDISSFNRSMAEIDRQNAPGLEMLKKAPRQTEFVDSMKASLQKLAPTDPAAAQILKEYYPPDKKSDQTDTPPPPPPR